MLLLNDYAFVVYHTFTNICLSYLRMVYVTDVVAYHIDGADVSV
jgi:hypothetical protein